MAADTTVLSNGESYFRS